MEDYVHMYIYTHIHKQLKIELFEGYLSKISHVRERFTLIRNMFKNPQPTGSPLARFFSSQTIDCKVPNLGCTDVLLLLQWDVTKCLLIHGSSAQIDPKVRWMWVYAWLGVSTTYIRKQIHLIIQLIT